MYSEQENIQESLHPEIQENTAPDDISDNSSIERKNRVSPVLKFRILIFIAAAVFALALKLIGGSAYENTRKLYLKYINDSLAMELSSDNSDFIRGVENDFNSR